MKLLTFLFILALIGVIVTLTIFWTAMLLEEPEVKYKVTSLQPEHYFSGTNFKISQNSSEREIIINYLDTLFIAPVAGSGSMLPVIWANSTLLISKNRTNLRIGDIVTYYCNNKSTVHRIIMIENGTYTMKGDANSVDDYIGFNCTAKLETITGRVVGIFY